MSINIFFLSLNTEKCAQYHCDKHVVKMILETAQILSSAHWMTGSEAPYRLTHKNHPCSIWARGSLKNYIWLCDLGKELCAEYTFRYDKIHKTQEVIQLLSENRPSLPVSKNTKFPRAMPEKYHHKNIVKSYRDYYIGEKFDILSYKKRGEPKWMKSVI